MAVSSCSCLQYSEVAPLNLILFALFIFMQTNSTSGHVASYDKNKKHHFGAKNNISINFSNKIFTCSRISNCGFNDKRKKVSFESEDSIHKEENAVDCTMQRDEPSSLLSLFFEGHGGESANVRRDSLVLLALKGQGEGRHYQLEMMTHENLQTVSAK